jgi:3-hydroxybutyryl-CoA dehydrogenase
MKVVIAGEGPLAADLSKLCTDAGHTVSLFLVETLREAQTAWQLDEEAQSADIAIECHNESKEAKRRLIEIVDSAKIVCASALACSTTEAASWAARPALVAGWGALPPLEKGGVMELAAGLQSSAETMQTAQEFWASLGLQTITVADGPGLVRARILSMLVNEAATALMEGVAAPADIDTAMRLGTNYPRGPLAWGDLIGLDVVLGVLRGLHDEYGEDRYRPCPLLTRYAQAGRLGQKSGKGFFDYPPADGPPRIPQAGF